MARAGDTLVIWRLDRLGRSLKHLIHLVEKLDHQGIGLRSLQENIDTTTSGRHCSKSDQHRGVLMETDLRNLSVDTGDIMTETRLRSR